MLWDLAEGKRLYNLDAGEVIYALCFSPNRYWLCAATTNCIKVRAMRHPRCTCAVGWLRGVPCTKSLCAAPSYPLLTMWHGQYSGSAGPWCSTQRQPSAPWLSF